MWNGGGNSSSGSDPTSSSEPTSVVTPSEDSTFGESSEIPSEEPSDPELTQAHINAISGDNLTLSGTLGVGWNDGTSEMDVTIKYTDGYMEQTQAYYSGSEYYSDTYTYIEDENGHVAYPCAPNIYNQTFVSSSTLWGESSLLVNKLGQLSASWFEWDSAYVDSNGRNRFVMTEEALASEEVYYAEIFLGEPAQDLQYYYIYTDSANENIVNIAFYDDLGNDVFYDFDLDVLNVGTTQIDETTLYSPYSVPSGQETQYSAFESAIAHLEEHNYTANVQCIDTTNPDHIYQESKYEVTENGYSGVDRSYEYTTDEETLTFDYYFGTHRVEDGTYDYYVGYSADSLWGVAGAVNNPWYNLPDHQFAVEIFELVEEESTSDTYVFQLREDYMENNHAYYVAGEFTSDSSANSLEEDYEAGYNLKISISSTGYIESFEFIYESDEWIDGVYTRPLTTFKQTFSDWGTTSITDDVMGDFTNYTAYEYPNFDNTYFYNYNDDGYYNYISIRDALVDLFGDTVGNAIPDFMAADKDISSHYSSYYYDIFYPCLRLIFDYPWTNYDWDELEAGNDAVAQALIDAGATLTEDDDDYVYEGTMCEGQVSVRVGLYDYNYSDYYVAVQFALPSTTTAG